jgi:hypothetical protein
MLITYAVITLYYLVAGATPGESVDSKHPRLVTICNRHNGCARYRAIGTLEQAICRENGSMRYTGIHPLEDDRQVTMALTKLVDALFERKQRDYAAIVAEVKSHPGKWHEIIGPLPITNRQANDCAAHLRSQYESENLSVTVRAKHVFVLKPAEK